MFYVIQRHSGDKKKHYIAYTVPKYITSQNSHNVIFEFRYEGSVKRKWAPKEEIILLTPDKKLFQATLERLESIRQTHLERIDAAQAQLDAEISALMKSMQEEFSIIQTHNGETET